MMFNFVMDLAMACFIGSVITIIIFATIAVFK